MLNDWFRIQNINPNGYIIKRDIDHEELEYEVKKTILSSPYYSSSVLMFIRQKFQGNLFLIM